MYLIQSLVDAGVSDCFQGQEEVRVLSSKDKLELYKVGQT